MGVGGRIVSCARQAGGIEDIMIIVLSWSDFASSARYRMADSLSQLFGLRMAGFVEAAPAT